VPDDPKPTILASTAPAPSLLRRHRVVAASVAAHLVLLGIIVFHNPKVFDVGPEWLAHGDGPHSYQLIYVAPDSDPSPPDAAKLLYPKLPGKPRPRPHAEPPKPAAEPQQAIAEVDPGDHNSHAGSALGTVIDGPVVGHEVHVAYPTVYPNPPVDRAELPRDLVGDVVVEVTIDSTGAVVETKIVQAIGHGIDEKIAETLRRWHYQPATLDGTPVASRHDVHFHFPS
jgi:periplasmic protein TonB